MSPSSAPARTLIGAGLPLQAALRRRRRHQQALSAFAGAIRAAISAGDSFAGRWSGTGRHQPIGVAMVRAGEASGRLEPVLRAIVEDRTRGAARGPDQFGGALSALLVGTAVAILAFFLIYGCRSSSRCSGPGRQAHAGARSLLAASRMRGNLDLVLGAAFRRSAPSVANKREWRAKVFAAVSSLPGIAGTVRDRRTARIIGTLGLLTENGVALPATLKILRDVVTGPRYVAAIDRLFEQVRNGRRFGDALAETDLLPPLAVRMLKVGDETGDLPSIARHAAQFYEHRLGLGLDRLMGAVGPATIIVVSFVIGALIISIMSALLSITEAAL
jgi:general secretion pathway protein F